MRSLFLFTLVSIPATLASAQAMDKNLTFEAASVKPASALVSGDAGVLRGGPGTGSPTRVTATRITLAALLAQAYDVLSDQVVGPDWINDIIGHSFAVTATLAAGTTKEQYRIMLQNLLDERFHVRLHHVTQMRSAYELVVAEGGPKIKPWSPPANAASVTAGRDPNGFPRLAPSAGPVVAMVMSRSSGPAPVRMTRRETMANFCRGLGADINISMGKPLYDSPPRVVDHTGLTGIYEFTLGFSGSMAGMGVPLTPRADDASNTPIAADPDGLPDIFTAVEKQLGLKLRKAKDEPVDVIVVDSADKAPVAN